MTYLLALDQGTSSSRSIVFDATGRPVALAQRELTQSYPQPGWVEHDPVEIWQSQLATAREALAQAGIAAREVRAIGITNQRETAMLWDRASGVPVHPAIVWQDRRTESMCARLREQGLEPLVRSRTGLVIDAYFSATKIAWMLQQVPGLRARAERGELAFGTIDSWLLWQLTGGAVHATDVSNASRTMLFDVHRNRWDEQLLAALDVPASVLPRVLPSSAHFGESRSDLLGAAIPVAGIAGDQQAALFGQACFTPGMAKNTYGTGCFMLMHTGERFQASSNGLVTTSAAQTGPTTEYALEGSVFIAGAVVQWLRDGLKAIRDSSEIEALALSVPDAGGVSLVPAFTGLGAPYWKPDARGTLTGLTRGTTLGHIARAAIESIACQSAALLQAMGRDAEAAGAAPLRELRVDGGASVNDLLMQFQADLLGIPVVRPAVTETTALGAAFLAGLAVGVWSGRDEIAALWRRERVFEPAWDRSRAEERMAQWERAVRQCIAS
ncbi:glycerol kinase GlpK [Ramlibacter sp. AN1015]|uniref:glycerol kinase GlpK n=1 Tax=Ramlibacter sp. AN1015 TaxID=3133428 RepID=UPI0030C38B1A